MLLHRNEGIAFPEELYKYVLGCLARAAMASKVPKAWALPTFWISISSYKKQQVKKSG